MEILFFHIGNVCVIMHECIFVNAPTVTLEGFPDCLI